MEILSKTLIENLQFSIRTSTVFPNKVAEIEACEDGRISIFIADHWIFGFKFISRRRCLGYLPFEDANTVRPYVEIRAKLRIRIVEVEPAHVRGSGEDKVFISIRCFKSSMNFLSYHASANRIAAV